MNREYPPLRDVKRVSQAFELDEDEAFMEQQLRQSCERFKMPQAAIDAYIRAWKSASHTNNRIVNPTVAQIEEISNRYRIAIPKNIPREGWRSQIFAAAIPEAARDWSRQVPDVEMPTSAGGQNSQQETPPRDDDDPQRERVRSSRGSEQANKLQPLTFRRLKEIFAMHLDDADFVLRNGYLAKGEMVAIFGAGGIGKTRIVNQLIRDLKTGKALFGRWQTNGRELKILVLQTENSCRRMKSDLWTQCNALTDEELDQIDKDVWWHTLENSDDSFLTLASTENQQRIDDACAEFKPDIIVWDVLRDFCRR